MALSIDKDHPLNIATWTGFLNFTIGEERLHREFEEATGTKIPAAPKSPIEAMIDKATGYQESWIMPFIVWVTETYWGDENETPTIFYEKFKEWKGEG